MTERSFLVPEVLATHFHLRAGDKVGDFGAGPGHFLSVLSRLVGPEGKVYVFEIQKNLVGALEERAKREHLHNVEAVWSDIEADRGTKLAENALDVALVVNTLFQATDRTAFIKELVRTVRPGGRLVVVDWSDSWGGLGPRPEHVVNKEEAKSAFESVGLTFENEFDAGGHHYGLVFRK